MNHHFFRLLCSRPFSTCSTGSERFSLAGKRWEISTGHLAPHANSTALVHFGDTAVLAAIFAEFPQINPTSKPIIPMVTDYSEKPHISMDATQSFFLRSSRQFEKFSLISRSIDRSVRPLVPPFSSTLNLTCVLLASDGIHDPEITAINAASATLALIGPGILTSAAVRIGRVAGSWVVNPDRNELSNSEANYIVSCTREGVSMIQGHSTEVSLVSFYEMLELAFKHTGEFISRIETLKASITLPNPLTPLETPQLQQGEIYSHLKTGFFSKIKDLLASPLSKIQRGIQSGNITEEMLAEVEENFPDQTASKVEVVRTQLYKEALKENVLNLGIRPGGRGIHQLRDLYGKLGPLRATHGSALFQRGETQILSSLSLLPPTFTYDLTTGCEVIDNRSIDNFSLRYSNPDYSVRDKAGIRRDLGHSRLAEGGLLHLLPPKFPFSINLFCDVQSSGGSSSMTSICAASLALLDGGVPIKTSAAGVATGLLFDKHGSSSCILSDVQGIEDALGNMDFKVGGTREGITTCQLDIKEIGGIPLGMMRMCLERSWDDRLKILNYMDELISEPRLTRKHNTPVSSIIDLKSKSVELSTTGMGQKLRMLQESIGVDFHGLNPLEIYLFAKSSAEYSNALQKLETFLKPALTPELEFGALYRVRVVEVRPYGVMVQLFSSQEEPSMVHQSQLHPSGLSASSLSINIDDIITIKYFGREPLSGRLRLSRKAAMSPYEREPIQLFNT